MSTENHSLEYLTNRYRKLQPVVNSHHASSIQWIGYAAAATTMFCATESAVAAVVVNDIRGQFRANLLGAANTGTFTYNNRNSTTLQVNANPAGGNGPASLLDSVVDFTFRFQSWYAAGSIFFVIQGIGGSFARSVLVDASGTYNQALNFNQSSLITAGMNFGTFSDILGGFQLSTNTDLFLGGKFQIGGNDHLSALKLVVDPDISGGLSFTVIALAFETIPNEPILAGEARVVPEPSSLALLALGSLGLSRLRKRRK